MTIAHFAMAAAAFVAGYAAAKHACNPHVFDSPSWHDWKAGAQLRLQLAYERYLE